MKRGTISRIPKAKIPKLKRKLDSLVAGLVHERDRGKRCIDGCGRKGEQAGHFRRRELMSTRWNLKNINLQSAYCNCWLSGAPYEYAIGLDKKYGAGTAEELYEISQSIKQWSAKELQQLIEAAKESYEKYCEIYQDLMKSVDAAL